MKKYATMLGGAIALVPTGLSKWAHRHTFNYEPRPGFVYIRSRAISSRTNDNYDTFPAEELKLAWHTFIGKPVFVNHHNDNIHRKRGVIIDAALHEDRAPDGSDDTWVEVLMEVDALRFPLLAMALINHDIERTSMGTDVLESKCSYCGNVAKTPDQYCAHISRMKGQRLRRKNEKTGAIEDVLVHEICSGLSFFENSLLVEDPADPTAFTFGLDVRGILGEDDFEQRLAMTAAFKPTAAVGDRPTHHSTTDGSVAYLISRTDDEVLFTISSDGPTYDMPPARFDRLYAPIEKTASAGNFGFDSQKGQFDESGSAGVTYFKGDMGGGKYVDCLLWRDMTGELRGVLYHYPFDFDLERKGNVNVLVDPVWQHQGIATELLNEAMKRWGINFDQQTYTDEGQKFIDKFLDNYPHKGSIDQRLARVASFKPPRSATSSAMEAARKATEWIERDGHDLRQWKISYNADPKSYKTECTQCGRDYTIRPWDERQRQSIEKNYPRILDHYMRRVLTPDYILDLGNGVGDDAFFGHVRCDPVLTAHTLYRGMQLYDPDTVAKVYAAFKSGNTSRVGQIVTDFFMERGGLGHSWSGTEEIARGYAKGRVMSLDMANPLSYEFDPKEFARQGEYIPVFLTGTMLRSDQRKNYKPSDMMSMGPLPEYEHENESYLSKNEVMTITVEVWMDGKWVKVGEGIKAKAMAKTAGGVQVLVDDIDANDRRIANRPGLLRQEVGDMALVQFADGAQRMFLTSELTFTDEFFDGRVAKFTGTEVYGPFPPTQRPGPARYSKNWIVRYRNGDAVTQFLFAKEDDAVAFADAVRGGKRPSEVDQSRVLYAAKTAAVWQVKRGDGIYNQTGSEEEAEAWLSEQFAAGRYAPKREDWTIEEAEWSKTAAGTNTIPFLIRNSVINYMADRFEWSELLRGDLGTNSEVAVMINYGKQMAGGVRIDADWPILDTLSHLADDIEEFAEERINDGLFDERSRESLHRRSQSAVAKALRADVREAQRAMEQKYAKTSAVALDEAQRARFKGTGVDKDGDGYYCKTHRTRSDSYASIDEIPDSAIEFIQSTGRKQGSLYEEDDDGSTLYEVNLSTAGDYVCTVTVFNDNGFGSEVLDAHGDSDEEALANGRRARAEQLEMWQREDDEMKRRRGSLDIGLTTEVRVPPEVQTLRAPQCPVCDSDASWNSDGRCDVCGYLPPPKPFREPDTDVAGRTDQGGGWFDPELTRASPFKPDMEPVDGNAPPSKTAAVPKLPAGWRVEMIGLINAVQFTSPGGNQLLWGDGEWTMGNGRVMMAAPGVPRASTRDEARIVGTNWIIENWQADDGVLESNLGAINPVQSPHPTRKGQRLTQGVPMTSVASAARQRIAADRALADENARLREQVARLQRRADVDNPAQPVPEPASTSAAPVGTADATVDVESVGGVVAPVDLSVPGDVTTPGQELPATEAPSTDVEAPVSGATEVDPAADGRIEPDHSAETIGDNAFSGDWINTASRGERTAAGKIAAQARDRIWASIRLARLRIQAGTVQGSDDLELGRAIEASQMSIGEIQAESSGLAAALRVRPPQRQASRQATRAPSLAAGAQPMIGLAQRGEDEALFE